jgi:hypothetical protein
MCWLYFLGLFHLTLSCFFYQLGAAKATLTHFTVMPSDIGSLFAAGPPVVTPATHETVTKAQLGGPLIQYVFSRSPLSSHLMRFSQLHKRIRR